MNTVVLLLALAAAASANPIKIQAIDWDAILAKLSDVAAVEVATMQYVKDEATAGNAEIGHFIGEYLDLRFSEATAIAIEFQKEIIDETLTVPRAEVYAQRLALFWTDVLGYLEGSFVQLPDEHEGNIRARLAGAYATIRGIIQDVYDLLEQ